MDSKAKIAVLSVRDLLIERLQQEKYQEALQISSALRILVDVKSEELIQHNLPPLK